jgi:hypothetical protein
MVVRATQIHISIKPHKITAETDILLVSSEEIAFCQADIVYRIKNIGLAYAIWANETVYFFAESKTDVRMVFEIGEMDGP